MTTSIPTLRVDDWTATRDTFHLWTQIVGKVRMVLSPFVNEWWHVTLYVTPRGLTTGPIPYDDRLFEIAFDLGRDRLEVTTSATTLGFDLRPMTVADFHAALFDVLGGLGIQVAIDPHPNEVTFTTPFPDDTEHRSYDHAALVAWHGQLVFAERMLQRFRSGFTGKVSPVHLWWGGLDLAVTRFSGKGAPPYSGAGAPNCPLEVQRKAYDAQLSSAGFWPGGGDEGAFYSYVYPEASGFSDAALPDGARWDDALGEYVLPLEAVRAAEDPEALVQQFLQVVFDQAASTGDWPTALRAGS